MKPITPAEVWLIPAAVPNTLSGRALRRWMRVSWAGLTSAELKAVLLKLSARYSAKASCSLPAAAKVNLPALNVGAVSTLPLRLRLRVSPRKSTRFASAAF